MICGILYQSCNDGSCCSTVGGIQSGDLDMPLNHRHRSTDYRTSNKNTQCELSMHFLQLKSLPTYPSSLSVHLQRYPSK